ncbi:hypothetical protein T4E_8480 [Trichinella pseudospiralis]|uniref:Uncharacterized protein n=1 Tax=Trichinella pseudospiralis TaxID=6337 RepID=A0A0V0Y1M5_TRIPS|nr:hypothetical protein T4E_8480 [Trichinella pseudospiralis]
MAAIDDVLGHWRRLAKGTQTDKHRHGAKLILRPRPGNNTRNYTGKNRLLAVVKVVRPKKKTQARKVGFRNWRKSGEQSRAYTVQKAEILKRQSSMKSPQHVVVKYEAYLNIIS